MKSVAALSAILAILPFASAVGDATVVNKCAKNVCVYTTTPGGGSIVKTYTVKPGDERAIPYPANGMTGSQVRVSPDCDPDNVVMWEFAQGNNVIYYDVNIQGPTSNPFKKGLSITGSDPSCPKISCKRGGATSCFNNPNGHPQGQVKACNSANSIKFNACKM